MAIFEKFAPLNRFLIATNRVFLSDLPCSFFSSLYRTKPRALWSYLRESIFDLFFAAAPSATKWVSALHEVVFRKGICCLPTPR